VQKTKVTPVKNIVEDLRGLAVPLKDLNPDAANVRKHNQRNIDTIKASLSQFGQRKPVVVQKKGMVVRAGNGTLQAAKELGWTHVAAVVLDDDNVTATAFAIADNRTAELAEWDWEDLGNVLRDLGDVEEINLADLGWDDHEVENLLKADWEPPDPSKGDGTEFAEGQGITIKFTADQAELLNNTIDGEVTADAIINKLAE